MPGARLAEQRAERENDTMTATNEIYDRALALTEAGGDQATVRDALLAEFDGLTRDRATRQAMRAKQAANGTRRERSVEPGIRTTRYFKASDLDAIAEIAALAGLDGTPEPDVDRYARDLALRVLRSEEARKLLGVGGVA